MWKWWKLKKRTPQWPRFITGLRKVPRMGSYLSTTAYRGGSTGMFSRFSDALSSGSWRARVVSCGLDWFIFKHSSLLWGLMACWLTLLSPSLSSGSLYHKRTGWAVRFSSAIWQDVLHVGRESMEGRMFLLRSGLFFRVFQGVWCIAGGTSVVTCPAALI